MISWAKRHLPAWSNSAPFVDNVFIMQCARRSSLYKNYNTSKLLFSFLLLLSSLSPSSLSLSPPLKLLSSSTLWLLTSKLILFATLIYWLSWLVLMTFIAVAPFMLCDRNTFVLTLSSTFAKSYYKFRVVFVYTLLLSLSSLSTQTSR